MTPDAQQNVLQRLYQHYKAGSTDMADAIYRLPTDKFIDPTHHAKELKTLFGERPQVVAFSSELDTTGRFITLMLGSIPLLLVRDESNRINALVNLCRHRGARITSEPHGTARMFSCPFHAWCYALDGTLTAIPGEAGFTGLDREKSALIRLPATERHGLIWVDPRPQEKNLTIQDYLGQELDEELASFNLDSYVLFRDTSFAIDANWKLTMDGFLESYHIRSLHRRSVAPHFFSNLNTVDTFGDHLRLVLPKKRMERMFQLAPQQWSLLADATAIYILFPNTILVWQTSHFEVFMMRPDNTDPSRCTIRFGLLAPAQRRDESALWERNWQRVIDTVRTEDLPQAEQVQAGFAAGIQHDLIIGRNELGMQRFYQTLTNTLSTAT